MSKKYNVAVIGYGWAAGAHIAALDAGREMALTSFADAFHTHRIIAAAEKGAVKVSEIPTS